MQPLRNLGDYIRDQRILSETSLRQLAAAAGVSNPYLSQIERGLRKPSAEILQQIAKALRISAEALYVQAGMLDERVGGAEVATAIHADSALTERQKQVLLEIYDSFCKENESPSGAPTPTATPTPTPTPPPPPPSPATAPPHQPAPPKKAPKAVKATKAAKTVPVKNTPAKHQPTAE